MLCYDGRPLGANPHILIFGSSKVGNFIVSTPTIDGLKARFPDSTIGFIGSEITSDLEQAYPSIDWRISWDSTEPIALISLANSISHYTQLYGSFDLALNLDGFNPVTQVLCSLISPTYVAGISYSPNRRALLKLPPILFLIFCMIRLG